MISAVSIMLANDALTGTRRKRMSTEQMRSAILSKYPGWTKVNTMQHGQVLAIYTRMLNNKKL